MSSKIVILYLLVCNINMLLISCLLIFLSWWYKFVQYKNIADSQHL
jgi:hypothetical protein